jgi:hypothetical protein
VMMLLMHWCCWCADAADTLCCWWAHAADALMRCWCWWYAVINSNPNWCTSPS